ncbi:type II RES/Xre toxin-antitoxin system antitoxin [Niabella insulamsoli]|uniref:type II RES/Xre toxin-antitoxin system antitoxin n=1 Tax=Niabella insulamsoli TaxID=3144874 RepID=UPI0031FD2D2F
MANKRKKNYPKNQEPPQQLQDPEVAYITSGPANPFIIIAGKSKKAEWQMTAVEKMDMVRDGISKKNLESLKIKANLDYDKLSTLLSTTRATLINKKGSEHFNTALSERIVSIADVYSYGYEVFDDEEKFNEWVFRPNRALGGKQPFELLNNQFGREEVKNLIGRIDYGVYS